MAKITHCHAPFLDPQPGRITLPANCPDWQRHLLTDPQTSGGLLIACAGDKASALVQRIKAAGYPLTEVIGRAEGGAACVRVVD